MRPEVVEALLPLLRDPSGVVPNPSSSHSSGRNARRHLVEARHRVARSLGSRVDPSEVTFTSSGTEANHWAVRGVLEPWLARGERPHWILSAVEHDSLPRLVPWLESRGGSVSVAPVDAHGRVELQALEALIRPETRLVSLIWVNNETGVIQDLEKAASLLRGRGIVFHVDGAQAWGKLPVDAHATGADLLTVCGHKIGALAGSAALWVRPGTVLEPLFAGKQESGRRGGTENLVGIVAMGAAAAAVDPVALDAELRPLRDALQEFCLRHLPGVRVNGAGAPRVANTLSLSFRGLSADSGLLVQRLDLEGYQLSAGAACASGRTQGSPVLHAMGVPEDEARAALRISLPRGIDAFALDGFRDVLKSTIERFSGTPLRSAGT